MQSGIIDYCNHNEHITQESHKVNEKKEKEENSLEFRFSGES
jgi:hypothetical protein